MGIILRGDVHLDNSMQNNNKQSIKTNVKKLSFLSIYFLGINSIIGSGAFLLPQQIYKDLAFMSILVLIAAAVTVSMIALCYADLSSRFSGSGAAWLYTYNAFGKFTGFQVGLFSWFLGCLTQSAEVVALLRTLKNIFPIFREKVPYYCFAFGLIILLAVINFFGTSIVKTIDNLSSAVKMIVLVGFIVVGIFFIKNANFQPLVPADVTDTSSFITHFGAAFSVVFYMFTGFSFIPVSASKMKNPEKNVPKALITVMITVMILYALVQFVVIGILGPSIVDYDIPIAQAFGNILGRFGYYFTVVGMLISIFGVAFAVSFNTPILAASLATEHNLLPKVVGKKNKNGAPYIAIIITAIICCLLVTQSYIFLVACIVLASFVQYVPSVLAVIKFKHNKKFPNHGFSLKGGYVVPILALLISCYLLTNFTLQVIITAVVVFVIGLILYFTVVRKLDDSPLVKSQTAAASATPAPATSTTNKTDASTTPPTKKT